MNVQRIGQLTECYNMMTLDGIFQTRSREPLKSLNLKLSETATLSFYGSMMNELESAFGQIINRYQAFIKEEIKKECGFKE